MIMQLTGFHLQRAAAQCQPITDKYRTIWHYNFQILT